MGAKSKKKSPTYTELIIPTFKALKKLGGSGTNGEIYDQILLENMLLLLKSTTEVYVHGTLEASNKTIHSAIKNGLDEILNKNISLNQLKAAVELEKKNKDGEFLSEIDRKRLAIFTFLKEKGYITDEHIQNVNDKLDAKAIKVSKSLSLPFCSIKTFVLS